MKSLPRLILLCSMTLLYSCGSTSVPCAKTVWAQNNGQFLINVMYARDDCLALADRYEALSKIGTLSRGSDKAVWLATNYLTDKYATSYLKESDFKNSLDGDLLSTLPAFSSLEELPNPLKIQLQVLLVAIQAPSQGGYGGYLLGDTGVTVMDWRWGKNYQNILARIASDEQVTLEEIATKQLVESWSVEVDKMKQGGMPAEAAITGSGQLVIVARDKKPGLFSSSLDVVTLSGQQKKVPIDFAALVVHPFASIDLADPLR